MKKITKLNTKQIGLLIEIRNRAKIGNVILDSKQIREARRLIKTGIVSKSFPIYRLILKMDSVYAKAKYIRLRR